MADWSCHPESALGAFLSQTQGHDQETRRRLFFFLFLSPLFSRVSRVNPGWRLHQLERVQRGRSDIAADPFPFSACGAALHQPAQNATLGVLFTALRRDIARRAFILLLPPSWRSTSTFDGACRPLFPTLRASGPQRRRNRLNCDRQLRNFQPSVKCTMASPRRPPLLLALKRHQDFSDFLTHSWIILVPIAAHIELKRGKQRFFY
jgi:hypothetical protein